MDVTQVSIVHHIALVLLLLWIFASFGWSHPIVFFCSLLYLYAVNERYSLRLRRRLQYEERKFASQRRLLSDSESVRWLNHAIEKIWPICMERIASQQFLLAIIPWFLEKYKPWTAKKAVVQHLYLGRSPPMVTEIRVLGESSDDDHLVLELGMSFLSAQDMSAILEVQLRKRFGLGLRTKLHVTGMHVEGKVLVGVKFLDHWPFLGRVRVCFVEPPYFQMTVKPIFTHGVDVTELPGVAGWLDNLLAVAFEQTLVEPNMLVVDVEKFVSASEENWFTVDEKPPIAFVKLEIVEAADMKPSDMNGLADPYVKGQLGPYRFRTKIQKKTLTPKWVEEFRIPICSWEAPNLLVLEVRDKDPIFDDMMGDCSINIGDLRGGQRHEKWWTLQSIKMGRLLLAITVLEGELEKEKGFLEEDEDLSRNTDASSPGTGTATQNFYVADASVEGQKVADEFEPIKIEGQEKTGIFVHHPGSEVSQTWEPRKGRVRRPEIKLHTEDNDSVESPRSVSSGSHFSETNGSENVEGSKVHKRSIVRKGLHKIGSIFHKSPKSRSPRKFGEEVIRTPHPNLRAVGEKGTSVNLIVDDNCAGDIANKEADQESILEKSEEESVRNGHVDGQSNMMGDHSPRNLKAVFSRKDLDKSELGQASDLAAMENSERPESSNSNSTDIPQLTVGKLPLDTLASSGRDKKLDTLEQGQVPDLPVVENCEGPDFSNSTSGGDPQLTVGKVPTDTLFSSDHVHDSNNAKSGSTPISLGDSKEQKSNEANVLVQQTSFKLERPKIVEKVTDKAEFD